MASKDILLNAQAPILKCEICFRGEDARFYCKECTQEMCRECKTTHLWTKVSRNHTVIRIAADKDPSGKYFSQTMCQTHPEKLVQMYCISCDVLVCHECITDNSHKNHNFEQLENIAEKYKRDLLQLISETNNDVLHLETLLQSIQNNVIDYKQASDQTIKEINDGRNQIKSTTDELADGLISNVQKCSNEDTKTMTRQAVEVHVMISERKRLQQLCEEKLRSDIDTAVKTFVTKAKHKMKSPQPSFKSFHPPLLVKKDEAKDGLKEMLGNLEYQNNKTVVLKVPSKSKNPTQNHEYKPTAVGNSVNISKEVPQDKLSVSCFSANNSTVIDRDKQIPTGTSVNISSDLISSINTGIRSYYIASVSDEEAWCGGGFGYSRDLVLIQTNGTIKKEVQFENTLSDFIITSSNDVLFTESEGHTIQKYILDRKSTVIIDTAPFKTRGIWLTADLDLLVCLYSGRYDDKVVRMSMNGEIKQTIQYNKQDKPMFSFPRLVTENINGDICVVDDFKTVAVVNKDGQFRFRYPESETSNILVGCYGISCDKLGYILVSDFKNNRIHQINLDGKFVQFILTKQNGILEPRALNVDDKGQIWVCNRNGDEVRVYKYRS